MNETDQSWKPRQLKGSIPGLYLNGVYFDQERASLFYDPEPRFYKYSRVQKILTENGEIVYPFEEASIYNLEIKQLNFEDDTIQLTRIRTNAFWLQFNLGGSAAEIRYSHHPTDYVHLGFAANLRKSNSIYAAGVDLSVTECWGTKTYWATYGYTVNSKWMDSSVSVGPGFSKWRYYTESERGTINSPWSPGIVVRIQTLLHFPVFLGMGFGLSYHKSQEVSYWAMSYSIALGNWFW